jgi:probable HAF family extracellular repeat protein
MQYRDRQLRRPTAMLHVLLVVSLTSLALTVACDEQDRLPTSPPKAMPVAPQPAILGATVAGVPFSVAAINDAGQVVGTQQSGGTSRALLWTAGGGVQDLGTLGGASSWAYGINESGQVVGASLTATGERHAFLWTPGEGMRDLGTLDGARSSTARDINDHGQVVGESTFPPVGPRQPATHAFVWTLGEGMLDLGTLSEALTSSIAFDINNAGQVVGRAFSADRQIFPPTDPEFFSRAFLWAPGQGMRDLGDLGGGYSVAYAINDAGQVVGKSWLSRSVPEYGILMSAFMWTADHGIRDLGSLWSGPSLTVAYGINEAGQVVGESDLGVGFRAGFPVQGFLWTAADGMEALSPTTGMTSPRGINDRQQVIGDGRLATLQLAPGNDTPVAVPNGPYSGLRRSAVTLNLSGTDNDDVGFVYNVSFGDGSDWVDINPPSSHTYADNGTYTLTLTVRDRRGGTDTKTTTVTIANVAPTIVPGSLTGPAAPIQLTGGNASAPIAFEFTDPGRGNDIYSAEIACGNGVVLTAMNIRVTDVYLGNGVYTGKGTYAGACAYTSPGVYTVRASVSDDAGGVSAPAFLRYVVVYDPAGGGSVTAGGFYTVPGQGDRKAHFTFSAKFLSAHGATPDGAVKFWIPDRELDFESTVIEMLVVSGNRAQFWGTGTLNGAASRFRITAVDGQQGNSKGKSRGADAIRVELWDAAGTLVYDSQPGAAQDAPVTQLIEGGSIQIH